MTLRKTFSGCWLLLLAGGCGGAGQPEEAAVLDEAKVSAANASFGLAALSAAPAEPAEYHEEPLVDTTVSSTEIEMWASFYRPAVLAAGQRYPLLVFLHGNHPTCGKIGTSPRVDDNNQYADSGTCPDGYQVVKNHRGYDYITQELAARGYFVLSINANRTHHNFAAPADDPSFIGERGRLLLRHLEKMTRWNRGEENAPDGTSLSGRFDFSQVGLFGHSRGGQGVRFAYEEYRRSGSVWPARIGSVSFRGIFEIGPTDDTVGTTPVNASQTRWNVLIPGCDWDNDMLPGLKPFDRMLRISEPAPQFKSVYLVWGANHNFYNTEWQRSDQHQYFQSCINQTPLFDWAAPGSELQRETGLTSALAFFTGNVGANRDETANALFDPAFPLDLSYRVDRAYHPGGNSSYSLMLEDFLGPSGTSSYGQGNNTTGDLRIIHDTNTYHDPSMRVGSLTWTTSNDHVYWQTNWARSGGSGFNLSSYQYLDFRVDRATTDDTTPASFRVRLVNANDTYSDPVEVGEFIQLTSAPRGKTALLTVRIPLTRFTNADLRHLRGARFSFPNPIPSNGTAESQLLIANLRATRATTPTPPLSPAASPLVAAGARSATGAGAGLEASATPGAPAPVQIEGGTVSSLRSVGADSVEIALLTQQYFDLGPKQLLLSIGSQQTSRYSHPNGDLYQVKFVLTREAWQRARAGDPIRVSFGEHSPVAWDFGLLDKSLLDR